MNTDFLTDETDVLIAICVNLSLFICVNGIKIRIL